MLPKKERAQCQNPEGAAVPGHKDFVTPLKSAKREGNDFTQVHLVLEEVVLLFTDGFRWPSRNTHLLWAFL